MADSDVTVDDSADVERKIDTRTVGGANDEHRQVVVLGDPASAAGVAAVDAANGVDVDVTRLPAGTNLIGKVQLSDGTDDATVSVAGARKPLDVHLIDSSGAVISSFGGAGGTSAADDADMTPGSTVATPIMGVYESSPTSVTDGDLGIAGINVNRALRVEVAASTIDVAHDNPDSGSPVLVGSRGVDALPTAVTANDRTRSISDLFGRLLNGSHITPGMQVWKSANITSTQTSGILWDPAAGKKIAITHLQVDSYGTTAGRIIVYFGAGAYVEGTSQPVFKGKHSPSATSTPGALPPIGLHPLYSATADAELRITTDAAISLDIVVYGYEF